MILHIARHGQIVPEAGGAGHFGVADVPGAPAGRVEHQLTDLGKQQAHLLGQRLASEGFAGEIYASPYYRTVQTAHIVAQCVQRPVTLCRDIREYEQAQSMAGYRGFTAEQLKEQFPLINGTDLPYPWWECRSETSDDVKARVGAFIDQLVARDHGDALLIGHGASVWQGITHVLSQHEPQQLENMPHPYNCALTSLRMSPQFKVIHRMCITHIPAPDVTSNERTMATILAARKGE